MNSIVVLSVKGRFLEFNAAELSRVASQTYSDEKMRWLGSDASPRVPVATVGSMEDVAASVARVLADARACGKSVPDTIRLTLDLPSGWFAPATKEAAR